MSISYGGDNITFPDASTQNTSPKTGFVNRIINGGMTIDQRNAGASVTNNNSGSQYSVDRWLIYGTQSSKFTAQQDAGSVTLPVGFIDYLGITSTSAYSVGSLEDFVVLQRIEGFNIADLAWGTANAASVTVSFWVRSSLTGTFGGSLRNSAANRSYPFSYTISAANTWEQKSVTIAGDTTGTWLTTNGVGISLAFSLGAGSGASGTANAWSAGNFVQPTGATSVVGTNGATFYITGVQLEKGSTATPFEFRSIGQELALCQRYYQKSYESNAVPGASVAADNSIQVSWGVAPTSAIAGTMTNLPVIMRAVPTTVVYDIAGTSGKVTGLGSGAASTNGVDYNVTNATTTRFFIRMFSTSYYGIACMYTLSAEL